MSVIGEMQAAVRAGDVDRLRRLLQDHPGLPAEHASGLAGLLVAAAAGGHAGCVGLLLEHGADPGRLDAEGRSAADHAAAAGHAALATRLRAASEAERVAR